MCCVRRRFHASYGGRPGRRMDTIIYYNNPQSKEEAEAATALRGWRARFARGKDPTRGNPADHYHPNWLANRGGSELRAGWLRRLEELEFIPPAGPRL